MSPLAVDTWGMSGPTFAAVYLVLAIVALLVVVELRQRGGRADLAGDTTLTPVQIAYLREGPRLTVAAALSALHAGGAVDDGARPTGTGVDPTDPVEQAVLRALQQAGGDPTARRVDTLLERPAVRAALGLLRADLEAYGLHRSRAETFNSLAWALLAWVVVAIGFARIVAGSAVGEPVGVVTLETLAVGFVALGLSMPATLGPVRPAARLIARIQDTHGHLAPDRHPSRASQDATGAGLSVALFGANALVMAAPAFASTVAAKVGGRGSG